MEPFELEEEQRQQVDARFTINISQPINIDVPAYLILDKLRFALLNFMNTNIPRSEIETYFRSL